MVLYNTGCRVAEMCGARLDKCEDLEDMVRLTITGKGRKERKVDIEKALLRKNQASLMACSDLLELC